MAHGFSGSATIAPSVEGPSAPLSPPTRARYARRPPPPSSVEDAPQESCIMQGSSIELAILGKLAILLEKNKQLASDMAEIKETLYVLDNRVVAIKEKLQVYDIPLDLDEDDQPEEAQSDGQANFEDARADLGTSDQGLEVPNPTIEETDSATIHATIDKVVTDIVMEHGGGDDES